jgi:YgiT-type zinc finger domain-containing protein
MKCVVCHGESIEAREVKESIEVGSDVLYVAVTIPVCETCGERYYDRKTVIYLENVEAEVRAGGAKVREGGKVLSYG